MIMYYKGQYYRDYMPKPGGPGTPSGEGPSGQPGGTTPPVGGGPIVRKNQADMSADERARFRNAITTLIASGFYGQHVAHHANMGHRMHGTGMGAIGFERFLPWHRVYLDRLEEQMRAVDAQAFIPYWKWTANQSIPAWLNDFRPTVPIPGGSPITVTRNPGVDTPALPTEASITSIMGEGTYTPFARRLEGQPFGAHNQVHVWVGGTMGIVDTAPADPLFWMHHAEIDRLWHVWQQTHAGQNPNLTGADAVMDPWPDTATQVLKIEDIGYTYA
jgi:tyrosinase